MSLKRWPLERTPFSSVAPISIAWRLVVRMDKGNDLQKQASLLRQDSVHGAFAGVVRVDEVE